jgi:hypothetical protein
MTSAPPQEMTRLSLTESLTRQPDLFPLPMIEYQAILLGTICLHQLKDCSSLLESNCHLLWSVMTSVPLFALF